MGLDAISKALPSDDVTHLPIPKAIKGDIEKFIEEKVRLEQQSIALEKEHEEIIDICLDCQSEWIKVNRLARKIRRNDLILTMCFRIQNNLRAFVEDQKRLLRIIGETLSSCRHTIQYTQWSILELDLANDSLEHDVNTIKKRKELYNEILNDTKTHIEQIYENNLNYELRQDARSRAEAIENGDEIRYQNEDEFSPWNSQ